VNFSKDDFVRFGKMFEEYDAKPFFHSLINEVYQNYKDGNPQPWSL